jgi:hypothetical protein
VEFQFDDDAIRRMVEGIGGRIRDIVQATAEETADQDIERATSLLHRRLNALDGMEMSRDWCRNALETLRRGDELVIEIG